MAKKKTSQITDTKAKLLPKTSLYFFKRPLLALSLWLILLVFGIASYSTLLQREGFPSINAPFAIAQGTYLVNDPAKVDDEVAEPLNAYLLKQDGVKQILTQSYGNFYTTFIYFNEDVNADTRSKELQSSVQKSDVLPDKATVKLEPYKFGYTTRGDKLVIAFHAKDPTTSTDQLVEKSKQAASYIKSLNYPLVNDVAAFDQFESAVNPATGTQEQAQKSFNRFGERQNDTANFYNSAIIGVRVADGTDNLKLEEQAREAISKLNANPEFKDYTAVVSASFAPDIRAQIDELQQALLEGLIAILIVGSIIIAVRASLITVISMITVIAIVNGVMYLIGYSLNTITLFALILGLALIVDDTIIMTEAIDAQRRRKTNPEDAVETATRKIGRAMVAATSTAALSFAPLIFVGGILGSFIRAIPITIIAALITSLVVALIFIPLFARFILLRKGQMAAGDKGEPAANIEARIAGFISAPMLWAKNSRKKLIAVGLTAVLIGMSFVFTGGYLMQKVKFNIFPPSKDTNMLMVTLVFPSNVPVDQAQSITENAEKTIDKSLGDYFVKASYYNPMGGQPNTQGVQLQIEIINYKDREVTAPELVTKLKKDFSGFSEAFVEVAQVDAGPPSSAFTAQVASSTNREGAIKLATDVTKFVKSTTLKRPDGSVVKVTSATVSNDSIYNRRDNKQYVEITVKYADTDTTALLTLTKDAVQKEFPESRVASYGLPKDALGFDFGQESENQDSFKTLAIAFPILLLAIYLLLLIEFRSLLQPLLIFLAIPFSLFGITLGLYLTDNPFSFFAMLGFFALIGLSIKNTILLTDYANQARQAGLGAVDAAHEALAERFRPLIATSLTAVASLVPLAIMSPFWEGLAVVLAGGLLSSTFLVITVFPYYYLGAEFLRTRISAKMFFGWLLLNVAVLGLLLGITSKASLLPVGFLVLNLGLIVWRVFRRRKASKK
jgi:multidrug efflux pump subunit AcrB